MKENRIRYDRLPLLFLLSGGLIFSCSNHQENNIRSSYDTENITTEEKESSSMETDNSTMEESLSSISSYDSIDENGYRLLFIGNSYTYTNSNVNCSVDQLVQALMVKEELPILNIDTVVAGGYTLGTFSLDDDPYGMQINDLLQNHVYDAVILQDQSLLPVVSQEAFYYGCRALSQKIEDSGCKNIILFETWSRKEDCDDLSFYDLTYEGMMEGLSDSYHAIAEELNNEEVSVRVAPVGEACYQLHEDHPELDLYLSDGSHPTTLLSYLASCCIFSTLFTQSTYRMAVLHEKVSSVSRSVCKIIESCADDFSLPKE